MRIALVHDYLVQHGGAEGVLKAFTETFPDAPIFTLLHDRALVHGTFDQSHVITSRLQDMPFATKRHRSFPPLMPRAIEEFDFTLFDVVLSDSSSFAKGIITSPETLHISYVHTPMRYAWDDCQKYTADFGLPSLVERLVPFVMNPIRLWDYASAQRVDHYMANSRFVARRIAKYYHKEAEVINPPVDVGRFAPDFDSGAPAVEDYYLMVGRLIAYKRHDIAIDAFNELGLPLKIIGRGPEMASLKERASDNIEFLGRIEAEELPGYYQRCKGFIFPQEEDFGIVSIEALSAGRPVIAYNGGDIAEHVDEGVHGTFFHEQKSHALKDAVMRFEEMSFDPEQISQSVQRFDKKYFCRTMKSRVEQLHEEHLAQRQDFRLQQDTRISAEGIKM